MAEWDALWVNANFATMVPGGTPYGVISDGAIAIKDEGIAWIGDVADLPGKPDALATTVADAGG